MENFKNRLEELKNLLILYHDDHYFIKIEQSIVLLTKALKKSLPILICGNGGSAADSQHVAGELVGRFLKERKALDVKALTTDTSIITAWANDYSFDTIFSRQVEAYGKSGGILWVFSTSGKSSNILNAVKAANKIGMNVISMTGDFNTQISELSKINLPVPSKSTPRIQELHMVTYHYICEKIEDAFI